MLLHGMQVIQGAQERPNYRDAASDHHLISTVKPRSGGGSHGGASMRGSLSPLKGTGKAGGSADPQKKLDAVIQKIESTRAIYERCVLETSKAGELARTLERELG